MSQDPKDKKPRTLDDMVARGAALRGGPEWKPSPELLEAVAEMKRLDELPAPDPVVVLPEKGGQVVVTSTEAAETYVGPTAVPAGLSPRMPTGPVKIRADVDPRRVPTLPKGLGPAPPGESIEPPAPSPSREEVAGPAHAANVEHAVPAEPHGAASVEEAAPAPSVAVPSAKASSRPAAGLRERRRFVAGLGAMLVGGLLAVLLFRIVAPGQDGVPGSGAATNAGATAEPSAAGTGSAAGTAASEPPSCAAACPSVEASATATGAAPAGTTASVATSTSAAPAVNASGTPTSKPAPRATDDPYVGTAPPGSAKPASTPAATTAAPTAAPVVTATPSAAPAVTAAPVVQPSAAPARPPATPKIAGGTKLDD